MYYQFVEISQNSVDEIKKLVEKYKKGEIIIDEYFKQEEKIIVKYNDSKWIETKDGSFSQDLSKFTGTKSFVLWAKLVMKDKTVYENQIYTMNGTGSKSTDTDTSKKDNSDSKDAESSTKPVILPKTGINATIICGTILVAFGAVISYNRFSKYKDIK